MKDHKLPIGYYIKQADKLLSEKINAVQSEFGLTRTSWQILNSINTQGDMEKGKLVSLLFPFEDEKTISHELCNLTGDAVLKIANNEMLSLTEKGKRLFEVCARKQNEFREKSMLNISKHDYQTTVPTLEQIIKNIS